MTKEIRLEISTSRETEEISKLGFQLLILIN